MQFTPQAQAHADKAANALNNGDYDLAHHHLDAIADSPVPTDGILLAVIVEATRQHRT